MSNGIKRLGIILPASNITVERELMEFILYKPSLRDKVELHFTRAGFNTRYKKSPEKYLSEVAQNVPSEMEKLSKIEISQFAFFCTSGTLFLNYQQHPELKNIITSFDCMVEKIKIEKIKKPLIVTPYGNMVDSLLLRELKSHDIVPSKVVSLNLQTGRELHDFSKNHLQETINKEIESSSVYDGVFIFCTNFPTFKTILDLEKNFCLPIFSSNQTTLVKLLESVEIIKPNTIFNNIK